ncbi:hypothetical protein NQ317_009825 [Molorchus minor]|uniref:Uncharacterized protein n=1 Tax=Molorchus minor TaxID=1323400 RepID=A0ABQ9JTC1_9CUCU|nr:hypothetical protein NQ317_009825 [Molorchus minor]
MIKLIGDECITETINIPMSDRSQLHEVSRHITVNTFLHLVIHTKANWHNNKGIEYWLYEPLTLNFYTVNICNSAYTDLSFGLQRLQHQKKDNIQGRRQIFNNGTAEIKISSENSANTLG